jgi:molybdopterin molybdotransferase
MSIGLEEAQRMLLDLAQPMPAEEVQLAASCGRILARPLIATSDFPPFNRSPLDGYALLAVEVEDATPEQPVVLRQIANIPAGSITTEVVRSGTACRIMTGAPLPPGATGIVRLEDTCLLNGTVHILAGYGAAENICWRGEEIVAGEELVADGTKIGSGTMGMMAVFGEAAPLVYQRPQVALLATGSEIIPVEWPLAEGKIRNSNSYMLSAQTIAAGALPVLLDSAPDDREAIVAALRRAGQCAVVITTGGASVGDCDLIAVAFEQMGIDIMFDRVDMKPGMPVVVGIKGHQLYFGLSGNPAAASISFEQLVRPVLLKMGGRKSWYRPQVKARLAVPFAKSTGAKRFVWARWWQEDGQLLAAPCRTQGNGMLKSALTANGLIVIPGNSPPLPMGEEVAVLLLIDND